MKTVRDLIMNPGHFQMRRQPEATQHPIYVKQAKAKAAGSFYFRFTLLAGQLQ